jgi:hypothetical protein
MLTIADGGTVSSGEFVVAADRRSIGTLNIGAGPGDPPTAPGTLNTAAVLFGGGTGTINFNHTSTNYVFAPAINGDGSVNVLSGITALTANNTYTGQRAARQASIITSHPIRWWASRSPAAVRIGAWRKD